MECEWVARATDIIAWIRFCLNFEDSCSSNIKVYVELLYSIDRKT
jgi:hypothetical protein